MHRCHRAATLTTAALLLSACAEPHRVEPAAAWTTSTQIAVKPTSEPVAPGPIRIPPQPTAAPPAARIRTASLAPITPATPKILNPAAHHLNGIASFYWQDQKTATGEQFDKTALTAAHKTLPFGTRVKVTNQSNGRSVVVRINDRGPFKPGRVIDLSLAAAEVVGMRDRGLAPVNIEIVE